jgi:hypothetical protein
MRQLADFGVCALNGGASRLGITVTVHLTFSEFAENLPPDLAKRWSLGKGPCFPELNALSP